MVIYEKRYSQGSYPKHIIELTRMISGEFKSDNNRTTMYRKLMNVITEKKEPIESIYKMVEWAKNDPFWSEHIYSTRQFSLHFDDIKRGMRVKKRKELNLPLIGIDWE